MENTAMQERLNKLLNAYSHRYDIERDVEVEGGSLPERKTGWNRNWPQQKRSGTVCGSGCSESACLKRWRIVSDGKPWDTIRFSVRYIVDL